MEMSLTLFCSPLERYNSLTDENLEGFFASPEKRKYLQRMGLVSIHPFHVPFVYIFLSIYKLSHHLDHT